MSERPYSAVTGRPGETGDVLLKPQAESALRAGLAQAVAPKLQRDFNTRVLSTLTSGQDFAPWWRQVATRLKWMFVPAALGFGGMGVLLLWPAQTLPPLPSMTSARRYPASVKPSAPHASGTSRHALGSSPRNGIPEPPGVSSTMPPPASREGK